MNPTAAFPIMMGSCAFLMPVGERALHRKAQLQPARRPLGLALGGIPGGPVAAYLVKSLPLRELRWLVFVVVLYTAVAMLRSARAGAPPERAPRPAASLFDRLPLGVEHHDLAELQLAHARPRSSRGRRPARADALRGLRVLLRGRAAPRPASPSRSRRSRAAARVIGRPSAQRSATCSAMRRERLELLRVAADALARLASSNSASRDRPRPGDALQLLVELDHRLLGLVGLHAAAGVPESAVADRARASRTRRRSSPCPRAGSG